MGISQEAIYHGILDRISSRYQVFDKLLWKLSEDSSKGHLGIKFTPNISKSSDSFSTVPPIVNAGDWGGIVHDLETIRVSVLLAFNFIPQMAPFTNLAEVSDQGLCYCNSNTWG